jgi:hypothetical protein
MKPSVANRLQKRLREQDDKRKGRKEELKRKVKGLRRKYLSRSPPRENDSDSDSPSDSESESDSDGRRRDDSLDVYRGKRRASPVRKRRERSDSDKSDSEREKREKRKREKSESGSERSDSEKEKREKEKRKRRVRSESDSEKSEKSDSEKSDSEREKREKEKRKRRERSESDSGKSDSEREKRRKREKSDSDKPESPKRERREKRETERPREDTETKTARMEWDQIREEERMEEERLERDRRDRDRAAGIVPKPVEKAPFVISGGEEKGESFEVQEEPYEVHAENEAHENEVHAENEAHENEREAHAEKVKEREKQPEKQPERETRDEPEKETRDEPEREQETEEPEREHEREQEPEEPESVGKDFDESVLRSKFQYAYEDDRESVPSEQYNSKRIEQFILGKGFLILEYFLVHDLCSFILVQLPAIGETMMVYVNRQKYPINVSGSAYPKTDLERLKLEKNDGDTNDYENISMKGFDVAHSLDRISDTNGRQKSLAYYVQRQVQRMMYVTQHIDIKPCILLNGIFGFYDTYHIVRRPVSSEFYPVISLEILFSKTFLLEQNIPVFYGKLYSIMNQSNRNKMEYLLSSLRSLGERIERFKRDDAERDEKERDRGRLKAILTKLGQKQIGIEAERAKMRGEDRIAESYATRRLNDEWAQWEGKRVECNSLYGQVKREYDKDVFMNEVFFHELYYKIRDMEQMIEYLD